VYFYRWDAACEAILLKSLGHIQSQILRDGRYWIVDAHRDDGKRYVVRSEEMLTAFLELEQITHELAVSALLGDDSGNRAIARRSIN
jgi:hypothetical protein